MLPIVTPEEMAAIDAAAPEPVDVLIERAGAAVAWAALRMLGGGYGRTVNVICGKGNNGADGRSRLVCWRPGVRVRVVEAPLPSGAPGRRSRDRRCLRDRVPRNVAPPDVGDTPVLAVDLPSGVDGLTGDISGDVLAAAAPSPSRR